MAFQIVSGTFPLAFSMAVLAGGGSLLGADFSQKAKIDAIVEPLIEAEEVVGAVVGIVTPEGNYVLGYGKTSHAGSTAPDGGTIFEIGSLSKTFTGVLLAELVHQKKVALDDPVHKFLPEMVVVPTVGGKEMTLGHLATHTAGLPLDPTNLRPKDPRNRFEGFTETQLYACLGEGRKPSPAKPSAPGNSTDSTTVGYQYSNVGVGLLGHLLERIEGAPYERLLVKRICEGLMLTDTRITLDDQQRRRLASGYLFYDQLAPNISAGCIPGCIGLRSTANDLMNFLAAHVLGDSKVASAARLASAPQHQVNEQLSVGLCWHIDKNSGVVWHGGTTTGFTSAMAFHKSSGIGVVVLTNSKSLVITQLAGAILVAMRGNEPKPIPMRRRIQIPEDRLNSYVGVYQGKSKSFLEGLLSTKTVVRDGKHLRVNGFKRGEEFPIYPESDARFFCKGEDIYATFRPNKEDKELELELSLWGYKSVLTKIQ